MTYQVHRLFYHLNWRKEIWVLIMKGVVPSCPTNTTITTLLLLIIINEFTITLPMQSFSILLLSRHQICSEMADSYNSGGILNFSYWLSLKWFDCILSCCCCSLKEWVIGEIFSKFVCSVNQKIRPFICNIVAA